MRRHLSVWMALIALGAQTGCIVPLELTRLDDAVALPSGAPESECEKGEWLEIAPTRAYAYDQRGYMGAYSTTIVTQGSSRRGLGVYELGGFQPMYSGDVFDRIDAPALEETHMGRIHDTQGRYDLTMTLVFGGLAGVLGGSAVMLTPIFAVDPVEQEPLYNTLLFGGAAVMVGGLFVMVTALLFNPSPIEMNQLNQRKNVFYKFEDDLEALKSGVDRHNQEVRRRCK